MSLLTIRGLYNYHPTLFDELIVPDYWDKETLIGVILRETDEREVLYSNPAVMETAIMHWGNSWLEQWQRLAKALQVEYAPLENYDRYEESTDNTDTTSKGNSKAESIGRATGFNSDSLVTIDGAESESSGASMGNTVNTHSARFHGNIGVTTSQRMLQSEIDLRKYNWYNEVAKEFANTFTLGVW